MKKFVLITQLALLICSTVADAQENKLAPSPEVGKYCKVYTDNENFQITILRFGKFENNEALIKIEGVDHPFDNKIIKAKIAESNSGIDISIEYESKDWVIFSTKNSYGGANIFSGYLPNKGKKLSEFLLYYAKELSNQCKPAFFLTAYLEQKK